MIGSKTSFLSSSLGVNDEGINMLYTGLIIIV